MKNLPIYENLDTSFVNLSALVRYLRRRQFVGRVRVELSGYEADITFDEANELKVYEHDRIAGRIAEGDEAFQRLLVRAREPGGIIHVYQYIEETETVEQKIQAVISNGNGKPFVQEEILLQLQTPQDVERRLENKFEEVKKNGTATLPQPAAQPPAPEEQFLPEEEDDEDDSPLLLEFSNRVEEKARQTQISPQDWRTLLQMTAELLGAIDKTIAAANLDFSAAFAKACSELSDDYPFLDPAAGIFSYADRRLVMREQVNSKLFTASINEALRRILERLDSNVKFVEVYRDTTQAILALIHQRRPLYDKFFITPQLEKILGV